MPAKARRGRQSRRSWSCGGGEVVVSRPARALGTELPKHCGLSPAHHPALLTQLGLPLLASHLPALFPFFLGENLNAPVVQAKNKSLVILPSGKPPGCWVFRPEPPHQTAACPHPHPGAFSHSRYQSLAQVWSPSTELSSGHTHCQRGLIAGASLGPFCEPLRLTVPTSPTGAAIDLCPLASRVTSSIHFCLFFASLSIYRRGRVHMLSWE